MTISFTLRTEDLTLDEIGKFYVDTKHDRENIEFLKSNATGPVSYTHLDVYKRQVQSFCHGGDRSCAGSCYGSYADAHQWAETKRTDGNIFDGSFSLYDVYGHDHIFQSLAG